MWDMDVETSLVFNAPWNKVDQEQGPSAPPAQPAQQSSLSVAAPSEGPPAHVLACANRRCHRLNSRGRCCQFWRVLGRSVRGGAYVDTNVRAGGRTGWWTGGERGGERRGVRGACGGPCGCLGWDTVFVPLRFVGSFNKFFWFWFLYRYSYSQSELNVILDIGVGTQCLFRWGCW